MQHNILVGVLIPLFAACSLAYFSWGYNLGLVKTKSVQRFNPGRFSGALLHVFAWISCRFSFYILSSPLPLLGENLFHIPICRCCVTGVLKWPAVQLPWWLPCSWGVLLPSPPSTVIEEVLTCVWVKQIPTNGQPTFKLLLVLGP